MSRESPETRTALKVLTLVERQCEGRLQVQWLLVANLLAEPPDQWPPCDMLLTLWTPDLPLGKLKAYVDRYKPLELNKVVGLMALCDRRLTLRECVRFQIPVPRHVVCLREGESEPDLEETEDYIVVDGVRLDKPFVEKPLCTYDHDIIIYYPRSAGGGRARLGRDGWGDAEFDSGRGRIRRWGSYVYERYIPTEGFQLRLFGVGSSYVHAEAKQDLPLAQSTGCNDPSFIPVLLEAGEKHLARKVLLAFGQMTFNIFATRSQQNPDADPVYLTEISAEHGGMPQYADGALVEDIARALLAEIENRLRGDRVRGARTPQSLSNNMETWSRSTTVHHVGPDRRCPVLAKTHGDSDDEEDPLAILPESEDTSAAPGFVGKPDLLAVLVIVRHGDRTPKQKVKLKLSAKGAVQNPQFLLGLICGWILGNDEGVETVFPSGDGSPKGYELRASGQMQRLHSVLLASLGPEDAAAMEVRGSGSTSPASGSSAKRAPSVQAFSGLEVNDKKLVLAACSVLRQMSSSAGLCNVHAKMEVDGDSLKVTLKWGGELTEVGETQARELGKVFRRTVYAHEDVVRMHASLRHDLKVHSSSEPRCSQTGAAFAQGLLSLQSSLVTVLVNFVRLDELGRLDRAGGPTFQHSPLVGQAKQAAQALLESGRLIDDTFEQEVLCDPSRFRRVRAELQACQEQHQTVRAALEALARNMQELGDALTEAPEATRQPRLVEALLLARQRWRDMMKERKGDPPIVSSDRVAAVLDCARFDLRYTVPVLQAAGNYEPVCAALVKVYELARRLANFTEVGAYGTTAREKFEVSRVFLRPMLRKLRLDLRVASGSSLGDEESHLKQHGTLFRRTPSHPTLDKAGTASEPGPASYRTNSGSLVGKVDMTEDVQPTVRSRLYFAHHSQMQTLVNLLWWAPQSRRSQLLSREGEAFLADMALPMGYLCHLVLKLQRQPRSGVNGNPESELTVAVELSPGDEGSSAGDDGPVRPSTVLHEGIPLSVLDSFLSELVEEGGVSDRATSEPPPTAESTT